MPTSVGKTRTTELAIVYALAANPDAKCIYVAPYRALVWEVERNFRRLFSNLGYTISSIVGSYESDDFENLLVKDSHLLIMTHEKLDLVLRAQPEFLDGVRLFVLDEVQIICEESRGVKFELLMTRIMRRLSHARFLLLSAVVPQVMLESLGHWLGVSPETDVLQSDWRPSIQRHSAFKWIRNKGQIRYYPIGEDPLAEGFVHGVIMSKEHTFRNPDTGRINRRIFPNTDNRSGIAAELALKFAELGPVLVFCAQTNYVESVAKALGRRLELANLTDGSLPDCFTSSTGSRSCRSAAEWLSEEHFITKMLKCGVATHHGRLPEAVRKSMEIDFRQRRLPILIATNTLAQ